MSVSKNWDTNLQRRERRTLVAFLALYLTLSCTILGLFGTGYYALQKEAMLSAKRGELNALANEHVKALRALHVAFDKTQYYPRHEAFRSGIFDGAAVEIFSLLHVSPLLSRIIYLKEGVIHYIKEPEAHYLGTQYLVLEVEDDGAWRHEALRNMAWFGGGIFLFLAVGGYFLLRLLLRPMREAIALLDRFIKDTTHELNTPIHAILSNIEMIPLESLEPKTARKLERIRLGAQGVSHLYQDLTYLTLGHRQARHESEVRVDEVAQERVEYFGFALEAKKIAVHVQAQPAVLWIDQGALTRLVDNVLSNAIKYNRVGGSIHVKVAPGLLEVKDTGIGIEASQLKNVFDRYVRCHESAGGFGIGLNIVGMIAKEYGLKLSLESVKGEGTCVRVCW
ncbi:MAG: sensor histidine kinase [Campylobacterales bacterium]|nr:sensor histidine kinase [Campylobacterales bacterium]